MVDSAIRDSFIFQVKNLHFQVLAHDKIVYSLVKKCVSFFSFPFVADPKKTHGSYCLTFQPIDKGEFPPVFLDIPGEALQFGSIFAWSKDSKVFLSDRRTGCIIDHSNSVVPIFYTREFVTSHLHDFQVNLFILLVLILCRHHELYTLHAAALSSNEKSVIIVGEGGSGKSTLYFSMLTQGWNYLSDDSLILERGLTGITVSGLRRYCFLHPETLDFFPDINIQFHPSKIVGEGKMFCDLSTLYPDNYTVLSFPKVLLFPEITMRRTSTLVDCPKSEAFELLLRQSGFIMLEPEKIRKHLDILKELVNQCSSYRFKAGQDVLTNSAETHTMLLDCIE